MADPPELTLPDHEHLAGCPAERVETFTVRRPDGRYAQVARCVECGGQVIEDVNPNREESDDARS